MGFYTETLGFHPVARWNRGAYLRAGDAWITLIPDPAARVRPLPEYTHAAFSVSEEDFEAVAGRIRRAGAKIWQDDSTEGDSLYFTDPNGHKLEIHASDLSARIAADREDPPEGIVFYI